MSLSDVLSATRSKYTPGERTSWETTTRSVPLMMNVPLSVIKGKSPMKTVWLLISPVVLFVNSAVTNSGAAYVMSLSLHSSTEALTSSKRGSEKDRDIEPEKSSIGEISMRISSRPPVGLSSPASMRRWNHASSPTSHSNDWVCRSSRSGTRRGSRIFAKETRVGAPGSARWSEVVAGVVVARDEAKMRPSENCAPVWRAPALRATLVVSPGRGTRAVGAKGAGPACSPSVVDAQPPATFPGTSRSARQARDPHTRAQTWTRAAQRGSLAANAAAVESGPPGDHGAGAQVTIET